MKTVFIAKQIGKNLGLRGVADHFMDHVESLLENEVIISFHGVETISRAFAHQYITRKKQSKKRIQETEMNEFVQKMFELIEK